MNITHISPRKEKTIDSEDTFSERSLPSEANNYEEDSFIEFESENEETIDSEDSFSETSQKS